MNSSLLLMVAGLALLDMLSPTALGVTVYLLLTEKRRIARRLFVYLLTVGGIYFICGLLLMMGLDYVLDTLTHILRSKVMSWGIFIIGVLLLIGSFYVPKQSEKTPVVPLSAGLLAMAGMGITTALLEMGMAIPYFAAIGLMVTSELSTWEWLPILIGYNLLMLLPPVIIYILHLLFAKWMQKPLLALRSKMNASKDSTLSWGMSIIGVILILNTLDYL
jgi:hypothetical protein